MATIVPLRDLPVPPPLASGAEMETTGRDKLYPCACGICHCNTRMLRPLTACWLCRAGDHNAHRRRGATE